MEPFYSQMLFYINLKDVDDLLILQNLDFIVKHVLQHADK